MSESGLRGLKDLQDDVVGRVGGIDRIRIAGIRRMMWFGVVCCVWMGSNPENPRIW